MIETIYAIMLILSMLLGGTLASGIFCMIERKRAGIPWANGSRSRCDACGRKLTFIDLIPVLSYILLRGKCRTCKVTIPPNGFRVELAWSLIAGVLTVVCIEHYKDPAICIVIAVVAILTAIIILSCNLPERKQGKEEQK